MIVATAGHVDHGKTALIKQITGEDTDKLAEEKRRGLTINLGFAFLDLADGAAENAERVISEDLGPKRLGFIDVPGHSRFINTMISGVGGVSSAMLVVAANEGPKPQTIEHLEVLRLLSIEDIIVVITFIDVAEPSALANTKVSINSLFDSLGLAQPPFFEVDNLTGQGVDALKSHIMQNAQRIESFENTTDQQYFRMSIDRAFTLSGTGLVVTGTVQSGKVSVGDQIQLAQHSDLVRVRSLRAENQKRETAYRGQRCALNIVSKLGSDDIDRGELLHAPELGRSTLRFDAEIDTPKQLLATLKHMLPVKLYLGAKKIPAKLALAPNANGKRVFDGPKGFVQLLVSTPITCCYGDRFLLRDNSEEFILAGGKVCDPFAEAISASRKGRESYLRALNKPALKDALHALLIEQQYEVNITQLSQARNISQGACIQTLVDSGFEEQTRRYSHEAATYCVATSMFTDSEQKIMQSIKAWHQTRKQDDGIPVNSLLEKIKTPASKALLLAAITGLIQQGKISLRGGLLSILGHESGLSKEHQQTWNKVRNILEKSAPVIPSISELQQALQLDKDPLLKAINAATRKKLINKVSDRRYALPATLYAFGRIVNEMTQESDKIEVRRFKQEAGIGRNLSVELLEYFDTIRFTQRRGEHRVVLDSEIPAKLFTGSSK
ncbi:MAG: selenocysteine-specific translation elongation factor [Pseudomonadales bacterium]